jgi:membrane protease YdiL (CAAX protease family)
MLLAETNMPIPSWLLLAVLACLPVCAVVFWRIGEWWTSSRPLPLPLDGALPAIRWSSSVGLTMFLGMVFLMFVVGTVYRSAADAGLLPWEPLNVPLMANPVVLLQQIVPPLVGLFLVTRFGRGAAATVGVQRGALKQGLILGLIGFAAILPVCMAALLVNATILQLFSVPEVTHPVLKEIQSAPQVWVIAVLGFQAAVLAPLGEEFIYRGVLMTTLLRDTGATGAIVVSSAVFALVHFSSEPQAMLPLFFLGITLAYVTYRTRSLVAAVVIHAIFNALMVTGTFLGSV